MNPNEIDNFLDNLENITLSHGFVFSDEEITYIKQALKYSRPCDQTSCIQWAVLGGIFGAGITWLLVLLVLP